MKQSIPEQKFYLICEYYNEYLAASIHWENILLFLLKYLGTQQWSSAIKELT